MAGEIRALRSDDRAGGPLGRGAPGTGTGGDRGGVGLQPTRRIEAWRAGADATSALDSAALRRVRRIRSRTEHNGGRALPARPDGAVRQRSRGDAGGVLKSEEHTSE